MMAEEQPPSMHEIDPVEALDRQRNGALLIDVREPAPNTGVKTALSNYVQPGTGMVLARVIFANGEASWVNGPTTWPPTPPTISPWRMRIHSAAIVCN